MKILVTGGTGLVGSNVIKIACEKYRAEVVATLYTRRPKVAWDFETIPLDLEDAVSVRYAVQISQPDAVIHCAAPRDEDRLEDLQAMFRNSEVKAILCARGGYGTLRLLEQIDYELIRKNPKIIAGFSDVTALLWAIHEKSGLITFHGPMVNDLSKNGSRNLESLLNLVTSQHRLDLHLENGRVLRAGKA